MPKLPPFALADERLGRKARPQYIFVFFFLFGVPLFLIHMHLLALPFFWDEHGQFIPTALDLLRTGALVAHSTVPNVHPPGLELYLAALYKLFGFSITLTRAAMLLVASCGLLFTFLLAIELSQGTKGAPAFLPPVLLLVSPLFYTQSMMAQLDMPAMVLTLLALLLFVKRKYAWAAAACVALVLVKETGLVVPFVFFVYLVLRAEFKRAGYLVFPAIALGAWLLLLHSKTGYWLGDPGFAHYNVGYALHPVRIALTFARRIYYLFFAEFRWAGTAVLLASVWGCKEFRRRRWAVTTAVAMLTIILVSVFGGAELERYLLPVLPLFYIAVSVGLTTMRKSINIAVITLMTGGLIFSLFWNPPYPFPYENNYAMVDFVRLQQLAAGFAQRSLKNRAIATAWPYTPALENPDFGFVEHPLTAVETNDFHYNSIHAIPAAKFDALITYTRTWAPADGVMKFALVRRFLAHFYQWEPDITAEQCEQLGLHELISWSLRGQTITIYTRTEGASSIARLR
jgi:hypothetical protein